ncbi:hypothetical protein QFC22_001961 [Naganishia vaughanmartiniae]|uniref:Uncharacterized protein n=1 Tax=Naganishia vaughanmartiniae TaxID=1424756 RepID=A0ACC2XGY9_9TREE|nr:hypothetical protein QFC22_001961 [Naganishia vaughanmartiniae]
MAAQTLEDFITEKFTALKLEIPSDDVEYIARLVEEEELEEVDKKEGVKGMVEGFMPEDMLNQEEHNDQELSQIERAIDQVLVYWQDLRSTRIAEESAAAEARQANSSGEDSSDSESETEGGDTAEMSKGQKARKALLDSLTPEELAAAQKRALLAQYGYVEEDGYDAGNSGMAGSTLRKREEEKEAADRRALIDKAIKEEGKRKRKGKRARQQVDLMAPNLNKAKVQVKAQIARDSAKAEANFKKDRDRAALEKQRYGVYFSKQFEEDTLWNSWLIQVDTPFVRGRADQAKAKADKQKKAQKGERRA